MIGLPGETIQIKDGMIYIDGSVYLEQTNYPAITNPGMAAEEIHWETMNILCWETTGTTVKTAGLPMWDWYMKIILKGRSGLSFLRRNTGGSFPERTEI